MSSAARSISSTLLARSPPPLSPSSVYDPSLTSEIDSLSDPIYLRSALHLANDNIDRAHELAQSDEGNETSDYLHGMLHRREGDYWNSKVRCHGIKSGLFVPLLTQYHDFCIYTRNLVVAHHRNAHSSSHPAVCTRRRTWREEVRRRMPESR